MERLFQLINKQVSDGTWHDIKVGHRGVAISHMLFTNDILIFSKTTCSTQYDSKLYGVFCDHSSQKVNLLRLEFFSLVMSLTV